MLIANWSVLDCRSQPAEVYELVVRQLKAYGEAHFLRVSETHAAVVAYRRGTLKDVLTFAQAHVAHIERHGCLTQLLELNITPEPKENP